jgi:hypothetical protein
MRRLSQRHTHLARAQEVKDKAELRPAASMNESLLVHRHDDPIAPAEHRAEQG